MDKPFNHLIICLTFVMPVAALSGCSGPNDSPEQDAVMSISSCTARGDDGQEMSVSEFGMFVRRETCIRTTSESSTGPGNGHSRRFPCRTGIKAYMRIILTARPSAAERWAWTQGARQTICIRKGPWCPGTHPPPPSPCIIFFRR